MITLYEALKYKHCKIDKIDKANSSYKLDIPGLNVLKIESTTNNFKDLDTILMIFESKDKPRFDYIIIEDIDLNKIFRYNISKINERYYALTF